MSLTQARLSPTQVRALRATKAGSLFLAPIGGRECQIVALAGER